MPGKPRVASPEVIAYAQKVNLDLAEVSGSGSDGRITRDDAVRAHWERMRPVMAQNAGLDASASWSEIKGAIDAKLRTRAIRAGLDPSASLPEIKAREMELAEQQRACTSGAGSPVTALAARVAGKGPDYALNPLVDNGRVTASAGVGRPLSMAAPTLFAAGDLPLFTASGIPPEALLEVPWQARHAMAAAPTAAEAYAIQSECRGADAAATAAMLYGNHPGNDDYRDRVDQWRIGAMSDEELYRATGIAADDERTRRANASNAEPLSEGDEQTIGSLVGGSYAISNGREPGQPSDPARYRW